MEGVWRCDTARDMLWVSGDEERWKAERKSRGSIISLYQFCIRGQFLSIICSGPHVGGNFYNYAIVSTACQLPLDLTRVLLIVHRLFDNTLFTH